MIDLTPIWLTLKLSFITTLVLLVIGIPLAYGLAFTTNRWKPVWEALVAMPLVLPPTVLGFYLLILWGKESFIGQWTNRIFGLDLVFTFTGLVVASAIYSLPFMVQPLQAGFASVPKNLLEASYTLGKSKWQTFVQVILPQSKIALFTGSVLSFAHTIGEFGVVLMIGGSIPGETRVASIAIFDEVESLNYGTAHVYAGLLFAISFAILSLVYYWRSQEKRDG